MTQTISFAQVETALGTVGLAWRGERLSRLFLPDQSVSLRTRMLRASPLAREIPPHHGPGGLAARIVRYVEGEPINFRDVEVDLEGAEPRRLPLYAALRSLRFGRTLTYGELGRLCRPAMEAREVGAAMGANPMPIVIPCHRVVAAGGRLGGFSAPGGADTKRRLLAIERAVHAGETSQFDLGL